MTRQSCGLAEPAAGANDKERGQVLVPGGASLARSSSWLSSSLAAKLAHENRRQSIRVERGAGAASGCAGAACQHAPWPVRLCVRHSGLLGSLLPRPGCVSPWTLAERTGHLDRGRPGSVVSLVYGLTDNLHAGGVVPPANHST
jgi:hypothetical protein